MIKIISIILGLMLATSALAGDFYLKSSAFENDKRIPVEYACDGDDISPPLSWGNAPAGTKSFVLVFNTLAWQSLNVYFWVLYNIPASVNHLEKGNQSYPDGILVGMNFFDSAKYHGPCPPDDKVHKYVFTLYALDQVLYPIEDEIDPDALLIIIKPHILKQTQLNVFFRH